MRVDRSAGERRSFVLIAVLVIVGSALLIATSLVFVGQTQATAAASAAGVEQSRALAWSGLQAVTTRLNDQRERILAGQLALLTTEQLVIYETSSALGVVRLLPSTGPGASEDDALAPESAKLDLNTIDANAMVRTDMIDSAAAAVIIAHRDQTPPKPFHSLLELLHVPGAHIEPEAILGPLEELTPMDDAQLKRGDLGERVRSRLADQPARCLADVLTVFSVEPALQQNGKRRINLNVKWSEELGRSVADRFGQQSADLLKQIYESGATFENEAKIFQALRFFKTPPQDWPPILDAFTTESGEYHFGRLDINSAPYEALLSLPGITAEQARRIVSVRQELSPQELTTIAWPAIAQIIPPEAYDQLAGKITTRSWAYRVRIAAGEADAEHPDGPLSHPVIYEAVIDLSAPKARIAYLRDITLLQDATWLAANAAGDPDEQAQLEATDLDETDLAEPPPTEPASPDIPTSQPASESRPGLRVARWLVSD